MKMSNFETRRRYDRVKNMRARLITAHALLPSLPTLILGVLALIFYGSFLVHRIDLTIADLGRHLQNGRLAVEQHTIPATNFYSYTEPDYPVTTHHWASGLLFFLAWKAGGFTGTHLLFIAISLATLAIVFGMAATAAGSGPATLVTALAVPLLAERTEIRPEAISYLFAVVFFLLLTRFERTRDWRWLAVLPLVQALWVNMHIYFFLGPVLIAIFFAASLFVQPLDRKHTIVLAYTALATAVASLLNPFFLKGALAPFTIFENYGYRIAENQPVWFVETIMQNPNFTIFKILFGVLIASFIVRVWMRGKEREMLPLAAIGIMISVLGWMATRNFALFGFFFVILVASNIAACAGPWLAARRKTLAVTGGVILTLIMVPALFGQWQKYFPHWKEPGLGLEQGSGDAAAFFRAHGLQGPLFNNYDIGGYLIWHLYPQEKVFVDNRPEAYPAAFFAEQYIPMQERDDAWQKALAQWQFNAIFFSHRDATPWAQQFLIARVQDPAWAPVYADSGTIIFLRRNEQNNDVIDRFEMPQSAFRIIKQ
ncbi:MAG: hypothetical protein A3J10_04200 [Candidatus Sungbacteria bacterium RIFCSPLOWO2_02_FULL_54_10]|nr:MAG: hypothetical protein A3J10_04200 [Candidatus Sungbacteria bacterium RIFCSPLOWO2_02_FULL_54_10]